MNFPTTRKNALRKLDYFIENNILGYTKLRNFDFGIQKIFLVFLPMFPMGLLVK